MTVFTGGAGADAIAGSNGGDLTDIAYNRSADVTAFSPDGTQVILETLASDVVPNDANGTYDLFAMNLITGAVTRVSTGSEGQEADGISTDGSFSPDGTKLVFESMADNLVANDYNGTFDVFVKDLVTGAVTRVSTSAAGGQGNGQSSTPVFSPDGTKVMFLSLASNLVAGDTNNIADLFIKDLTTGAVTRVDTDASGGQATISPEGSYSFSPGSFSPDGSKVAFTSFASNLVPGDTNGVADVFVKDLVTGAITRVNTTATGAQATDGQIGSVAFSPDGTEVAFVTDSSTLAPGDANGVSDVYVKNLVTGAITRASTNAAGTGGDGSSVHMAFMSTGNAVLFNSSSDDLVPGDTNGAEDIFLKDLNTGAITRVSTDASGGQLPFRDFAPRPSPDGTLIAFAGVLPSDPGNVHGHAFIKNIGDGSDLITGGGGGDSIDGKGGIDTAIYAGNYADYLVSTSGAGVTVVQDLRPGSPDGTDQLVNVEKLRFADQTIDTPPPGSSGPPVNHAPITMGDTASTTYLTPVTLSAASLLANDSDPDGDALSLAGVGPAQHGTVSLSGGAITFTPYLGFTGQAGFDYTASDGHGGTAVGHVAVAVGGAAPFFVNRAGVTGSEIIDTSGDSAKHQVLTGSGATTVYTGAGSTTVRLGAADDVVIGGTGKDTVTFGQGLGTVSGGAGPDAFIFVKGQIADPAAHAGHFDTVTDFRGAGQAYVTGRDFIWFNGFSSAAAVTFEHDLAGSPTSHLYRIDDGGYSAEFVLQYAGPGVVLSHGQYGFL